MDDILEGKVFRVSLFVWLVADVDLLWEKSTVGWLLVAGLFWEKSTAVWWLISQTNRVTTLSRLPPGYAYHSIYYSTLVAKPENIEKENMILKENDNTRYVDQFTGHSYMASTSSQTLLTRNCIWRCYIKIKE
jgi:hypothetical protein